MACPPRIHTRRLSQTSAMLDAALGLDRVERLAERGAHARDGSNPEPSRIDSPATALRNDALTAPDAVTETRHIELALEKQKRPRVFEPSSSRLSSSALDPDFNDSYAPGDCLAVLPLPDPGDVAPGASSARARAVAEVLRRAGVARCARRRVPAGAAATTKIVRFPPTTGFPNPPFVHARSPPPPSRSSRGAWTCRARPLGGTSSRWRRGSRVRRRSAIGSRSRLPAGRDEAARVRGARAANRRRVPGRFSERSRAVRLDASDRSEARGAPVLPEQLRADRRTERSASHCLRREVDDAVRAKTRGAVLGRVHRSDVPGRGDARCRQARAPRGRGGTGAPRPACRSCACARGSGVAPVRALVRERVAQRRRLLSSRGGGVGGEENPAGETRVAPTLVFFGCRHSERDFLYRDEWEGDETVATLEGTESREAGEAAVAAAVGSDSSSGSGSGLRGGIVAAFSRDEPGAYVQGPDSRARRAGVGVSLLRGVGVRRGEQRDEDARGRQGRVRRRAMRTAGGTSDEEAKAALRRMDARGKYVVEAW